MLIKELELNRFRNYESQKIEFDPGINIIYGDNGEGKTNIVEAIYLMSIGRSFRTSKDKEMINLEAETSYIKALVENSQRPFKIEYKISKTSKKAIKINGLPIEKLTELLGIINVVIFSPEDLKLVKEGPKERRSFIDREISQIRPKYYQLLSSYHKTLIQRNNLLKSLKIDEVLLDVYDYTLSETGYKIMVFREEFIEEIKEIAGRNHEKISSGKEKLEIGYDKDIDVNSVDEYYSILKQNHQKDIYRKTTGCGIHKDDMDIKINGIDLRSYGSQGQKRSAAISLKLSEIELIKRIKGEYPIVLLDDIFSELDPKRQQMLLETFKNTQTFVTAAEEVTINIKNTKYKVKNGNIEKY
ncbi:MAG: DNA replication/repair protein RecF [Proteocatella sp.]